MPGSALSHRFWYVYVLRSLIDGKQYVGYTSDLRKRMNQHARGESFATKARRPLELIYYEACRLQSDALRRERYLKGTGGRRYLAQRMKDYWSTNNAKVR